MFDDPRFDRYLIEDFPRCTDAYLVSEEYAEEYEDAYLSLFSGGDFDSIGYVSYIAVHNVHEKTVELAWYPNTFDRFHQVSISLPRDMIRACVGCYRWDWKPTIFADSSWINDLYSKSFSVFGLVDAIGIQEAIRENRLTRTKLLALRARIDGLAEIHTDVSFISFADSILMKSNWTVGSVRNNIPYSYSPEIFVSIAQQLKDIFCDTIGTGSYAILTQGYNEYYEDGLLHISRSKNHICLNSLGAPVADLTAIDRTVRNAIRKGIHAPFELYIDETLYHSLRLRHEYNKNERPKNDYQANAGSRSSSYFYANIEDIRENLKIDSRP